jgi:hypothetical protein
VRSVGASGPAAHDRHHRRVSCRFTAATPSRPSSGTSSPASSRRIRVPACGRFT